MRRVRALLGAEPEPPANPILARLLNDAPPADPELARLRAAWPSLSPAVRRSLADLAEGSARR